MGGRINAGRANRNNAKAQNIRQDNTTRRGNQILAPNNPFNQPPRDNYQTYPYDYFSGTDAKVFFGDIWVDDIITIQWNLTQSKTPIYGYASQYFDAVAKGQVIVQGTLAIAFKETGYLNIIQTLLERERKNSGTSSREALEKYRIKAENGAAQYIPGIDQGTQGVVYNENGTPQLIRQSQTVEQILNSKIISSAVSEHMKLGNKNRDFEDFAELLEDTMWGDANGIPYEAKEGLLKRPDEFDYKSNGGIKVGRAPSYSDVLNILITFGDINDFRAEHTLVAINDIHFQSQNMIVSPDGTPIAETYTFFARDINKSISKSTVYNINPIKFETGLTDLKVSQLENIDNITAALVDESKPKYIKIIARAALPRGATWQTLTPPIEIIFDQREVSEELAGAKHSEDEYEKLADTKGPGWFGYRDKKATEAVTARLNIEETAFGFSFNSYEPMVDQLIKLVQREFNETDRAIDVRNHQYIVDVEFRSNYEGGAQDKLTMVLEQSIPESRTYKVIAPTRQNFGAANIVTREDLFKTVRPADDVYAELDQMSEELKAKNREANQKRSEYEAKLEEVTGAKVNKIEKELQKINKEIVNIKQESVTAENDTLKLIELETTKSRLEAERSTLNDNVFNEADAAILDRKDRGAFLASRDDYQRYNEESNYYNNLAQDVDTQTSEFFQKNKESLSSYQSAKQDIQFTKDLAAIPKFGLSTETLAADPKVSNQNEDGSSSVFFGIRVDQRTEQQRNNSLVIKSDTKISNPNEDGSAEVFFGINSDSRTTKELAKNVDSVQSLSAKQQQQILGDALKRQTLPEGFATPKKTSLEEQIRGYVTLDKAAVSKLTEPIRTAIPIIGDSTPGVRITSGTEGLHGTSIHSRGNAIDIETKDLYPNAWLAPANSVDGVARDRANTYQRLLGENYNVVLESDHIHIEYDPAHPNKTGTSYVKLNETSTVSVFKEASTVPTVSKESALLYWNKLTQK